MAWDDFLKAEAWRNAMANLLKKGEEVGSYIEQAPSKAGQAILDAGQRQQALMNEAFDPTGKTLIRNPQAANQAAMNLLEGPLGFMPAGITAWHGSPHKFEKFDISKLGTGEGAQSYGHGMYFAENPSVAKQYKKTLSEKGKGNLYKVDIPDEHIPYMLDWDKPLHEQSSEVKKALETLIQNPNTLGEKPWTFKDAIETLEAAPHTREIPSLNLSGSEIYKMLGTSHKVGNKAKGQAEASDILNSLGIKGIRYSDAGSRPANIFDEEMIRLRNKYKDDFEAAANDYMRSYHDTPAKKAKMKEHVMEVLAKKPTSNFVVFDPTGVKILERNNQPLTRKEILEEQVKKLK
jgi:hypothetical protein